MTLLLNPLSIIAALVCAFMSHRVAGRIAYLSFVLATAPITLTFLMCYGASGRCSAELAVAALWLFGSLFLGALTGMLWQARLSLKASDLRQIPGWHAPSKTVRATYIAALAVVTLTTAVNLTYFLLSPKLVGDPGAFARVVMWLALYGGLGAVLLFCACAFRVCCILAQPDALWLPAKGARRRIAHLAVMSAGTLTLAALLVSQYVLALRLHIAALFVATEGGWLSIFLGLCAFELSRAKALRKAHSVEA